MFVRIMNEVRGDGQLFESLTECDRVFFRPREANQNMFDVVCEQNGGHTSEYVIEKDGKTAVYIMNSDGKTIDRCRWVVDKAE